jgi:hypothetical protein
MLAMLPTFSRATNIPMQIARSKVKNKYGTGYITGAVDLIGSIPLLIFTPY